MTIETAIRRNTARPSMHAAAFGLLVCLAWPASQATAASPAITSASVNMRAGPGTQYPVVFSLPAGAQVTAHGCLADYSWCDASLGAARGWVAASYMRFVQQGQPVVVAAPVAAAVGVSVIVFNQAYWQVHYAHRPWYGHWDRYNHGLHHPLPPRPGVMRSAETSCSDGNCTRSRSVTAPHSTRSSTATCGDGSCSRTGTATGPGGRTVIRSGTIAR